MKKIGRMLLTGMAACVLLAGCGLIDEQSDLGARIPEKTQTSASEATSAGTNAAEPTGTTVTELTAAGSTESPSVSESTSAAAQTTTTSATTAASQTALTSLSTTAALSQSTTTTTASQTAGTTKTTVSTTSTSRVSSVSTTTATTVSTAASSSTAKISAPASGNYTLTDNDKAFLSDCVFVGDSICSGLSVYKVLPKSNVVAKGCVAARSIFDYKFSVGGSNLGVVAALKALKPKYVIFSMGMNDVNMTSAQKYCENYKTLLTKVQDALPDAKLVVASITPITTTSTFCTNSRIDTFNSTIKSYLAENYPAWGYVDISTLLKNQYNGLISNYTSGDGIHLAPKAYTVILYQVCAQLAPKTTASNG